MPEVGFSDGVNVLSKEGGVQTHTVSLAELNAAKNLIHRSTTTILRIQALTLRVSGAFTGLTLARLVDTAGTLIASVPQASLTDGAVIKDTDAAMTTGASFGANLPRGGGVAADKTGSAAAGGTSLTWEITYVVAERASAVAMR